MSGPLGRYMGRVQAAGSGTGAGLPSVTWEALACGGAADD